MVEGPDFRGVARTIRRACDFCSSPEVVWSYHVMPLPISLGEDDGRARYSISDWMACGPCKGLIDQNRREDLVERSIAFHPDAHIIEAYPHVGAHLRKDIRRLHKDFFGLKNGPGREA